MRLFAVDPEKLPEIWKRVEPYLSNVAEHSSGKFRLGDVVALILSQEFQLWIAVDGDKPAAIALTEIKVWPRSKVVQLVACVGIGREDWLEHLDEIEAWAARMGATVEVIGRPGWARVLKTRGYRETHRILERVA